MHIHKYTYIHTAKNTSVYTKVVFYHVFFTVSSFPISLKAHFCSQSFTYADRKEDLIKEKKALKR